VVAASKPFGVTDLTSAEAGPAAAEVRLSASKPLISIIRPESGGSRHPFEQLVPGGYGHTRAGFDARKPVAQIFVFSQQQIGEAEIVARHPRMAVQQTAISAIQIRALGIACATFSSLTGRLKRGATTRLRVIVAETCGIDTNR
jgi:hypothetical protein